MTEVYVLVGMNSLLLMLLILLVRVTYQRLKDIERKIDRLAK